MESPSPSKYPNRDGLPLSQLSPERVNGRSLRTDHTSPFSSPIRKRYDEKATFYSPGLPTSPSLPEFSAIRDQLRSNTDVSGLVKRFEHLDVRDRDAESIEKKRRYEEALDQAKMAREEAESEAKQSKEDLQTQHEELEDCRDRERRACKRIDVLMDEFTRAKEQWSSQAGVYEKEVRRARKEAFKSSSAVLKLQEENKQINTEFRGTKARLEAVQQRQIKSEEDKFAAQYRLVAVQEELERLQTTLRIVQEERDALKSSLKEDEIARIASTGMIALPDLGDIDKENVNAAEMQEMEMDLHFERQRRRAAQDLIEFLRLECKFRCCGRAGHPERRRCDRPLKTQTKSIQSVVDCMEAELAADVAQPMADLRPEDDLAQAMPDLRPDDLAQAMPVLRPDDLAQAMPDLSQRLDEDLVYAMPQETEEPLAQAMPNHTIDDPAQIQPIEAASQDDAERENPRDNSLKMVTKTTKVPMNFSPKKTTETPPLESIQPSDPKSYPFDREAALAAIAYRRGRAKSFAQAQTTPRKTLAEGLKDRRDVSAPVITG